jgi:hypothetical protein
MAPGTLPASVSGNIRYARKATKLNEETFIGRRRFESQKLDERSRSMNIYDSATTQVDSDIFHCGEHNKDVTGLQIPPIPHSTLLPHIEGIRSSSTSEISSSLPALTSRYTYVLHSTRACAPRYVDATPQPSICHDTTSDASLMLATPVSTDPFEVDNDVEQSSL